MAAAVRTRHHLHRHRPDRKDVLADPLAHLLDPIYAQANLGPVTDGDAWLALGFAFQLLFDFSGYSDIAIGTALLFGVTAAVQFRRALSRDQHSGLLAALAHDADDVPARLPVSSPGQCADRDGALSRYQHFAAMFVTMALCGLWHGASWNFVLWGMLHGCALVFVRCGAAMAAPSRDARLGADIHVRRAHGVIFRAGSVEAAWHIFQGLAVLPDMALGRARADHSGGALLRVPAARKPGHRRMADRAGRIP